MQILAMSYTEMISLSRLHSTHEATASSLLALALHPPVCLSHAYVFIPPVHAVKEKKHFLVSEQGKHTKQ